MPFPMTNSRISDSSPFEYFVAFVISSCIARSRMIQLRSVLIALPFSAGPWLHALASQQSASLYPRAGSSAASSTKALQAVLAVLRPAMPLPMHAGLQVLKASLHCG